MCIIDFPIICFVVAEVRGWKLNVRDRDAGLSVDGGGLVCESRAARIWFGSRCMGGVHTKGGWGKGV